MRRAIKAATMVEQAYEDAARALGCVVCRWHLVAGLKCGERRGFIAARGIEGMGTLSMWAVDPVRASNDADHPHDCRAPSRSKPWTRR